jgi:hypothetical protein
MAMGFDPAEVADACRRVAAAVPPRAVVVNRVPPTHQQTCALWTFVAGRERGATLELAYGPVAGWDDLFLLWECDRAEEEPDGFRASGDTVRAPPICARAYHRQAAPR